MDALAVAACVVAAAAVGVAWRYRRRAERAEAEAAQLSRSLQTERHAARHDPLTGLPNRRGFCELGAALLANPTHRPVVAVLVDLDDFKRINDTLGHAVGDDVLVVLARRFAEYAGGGLVARLGGDEFVSLLACRDSANGSGYPSQHDLAQLLAEPVCVDGHNVRVTASVGLVTVHGPAGLAEVLRQADMAMYRAKNGQRRYSDALPPLDLLTPCVANKNRNGATADPPYQYESSLQDW